MTRSCLPRGGLLMVAPPYAHIFLRLAEIGGVVDATGFVQVQHQPAQSQVACIVGDDERAPGTHARIGHEHLLARGPRGQRCAQRVAAGSGPYVHGSIVGQIGFVQSYMRAVGRAYRDRGAGPPYAVYGKTSEQSLVKTKSLHRKRPCLVTSRKCKLGQLVVNHEILQTFLARKLVTESDAVVEHAEHYRDCAARSLFLL